MKRSKKRIAEMFPKKEWFSVGESCAYLDMSINTFLKVIDTGDFSISVIGGKRYYKVSEIQSVLDKNILVKKVS